MYNVNSNKEIQTREGKILFTPLDPRWHDFVLRLEGKEGCCMTTDGEGNFEWICSDDLRFSPIILASYSDVDVEATIRFFRDFGGICDCEVLLSVEEQLFEQFQKWGLKRNSEQ